ncbi:MAG: HlyD family efflux transporter periplasmic adaptor subunit [Vulcanococcus sp.]|jgi:HlyD family secretion protein|uniref:HlyD family efflux transporter periplasmic adaptor subunit n=1 Tax=unclassified Vulcanococcus TaxID=2766969 RepID=UPI0025CF2B36|nr:MULTISPECIES: HlyD family efflux transporter periplasmic adaptor subunit [unclassified Vulcanococcus]
MLQWLKRYPWRSGGGAVALLLLAVVIGRALDRPAPVPPAPVVQPRIESVSALGRLEPAGDVRKLAAPMGSMGGSPRISSLSVQEGDRVKRGQILATFDNRPGLLADLAAINARIGTLDRSIAMQRREVSRYREASREGAASMVLLEEKQDELVTFEGQRRQALAEKRGIEVDLKDSQLRSPIDGTVLRVYARPGERPGSDGILSVGASDRMEAIAEVYESDIGRIRLGQSASLISENGGFSGKLKAEVLRISPQIRQRDVLSTDPTGDADARIVEVRLALDPADAKRVQQLSGLKVIARFEP